MTLKSKIRLQPVKDSSHFNQS